MDCDELMRKRYVAFALSYCDENKHLSECIRQMLKLDGWVCEMLDSIYLKSVSHDGTIKAARGT